MSQKRNNNPWKEYGAPFLLCFALVGGLALIIRLTNKEVSLPKNINIVLSPHFDDAVLSLGGFMAKKENPLIVATFFANKPASPVQGGWDEQSGFKNSDEAIAARVRENAKALEQTNSHALNLKYVDFQYRYERNQDSEEKILKSMERDIEIIIDTFNSVENVSIYGPSEFGGEITHPDHKLVHDAFVKVASKKSGQTPPRRVRFFFYEDFPYTARYRESTTTPLRTFLEQNESGISLREMPLEVSASALTNKLRSIKEYASQDKAFGLLGNDITAEAKTFAENRCRKDRPAFYGCEVVYEIKKNQ